MSPLSPGASAPSFRLPNLVDGSPVEGPRRGALTLLLFTKASCPTCHWAMPLFRALHQRAGGGSLSVVGVAQDGPDAERALLAEMDVTYPVALELPPWSTSAAYELTTVPTAILVDETGAVALVSEGFARDDLLDVARLAAERDGTEAGNPWPEGEEVPVFRPG